MHIDEFAVDLITFFHPGFWGVADHDALRMLAAADTPAFWTRILDAVAQSGARAIELTFSPFGWRDALEAFGGIEGAAAAFSARGLRVASGFYADIAIREDLDHADAQARHLEEATAYAAFLARVGASSMVVGLPMRRSWNSETPLIVDLPYAAPIAEFCNRLGAAVLREGVELVLHTEGHSVFSMARDVDLFMLLTDPVYVGFCPDLAHLTLMGADPVAVVERHKERVTIVHWKDARSAAPRRMLIDASVHLSHRPYFCSIGDGAVDWAGWARLLGTFAVTPIAILEIDAAPDPIGQIKASLAFVASAVLPMFPGG